MYSLVQAYDKNEYTINIMTKISNFLLLKLKIRESPLGGGFLVRK